MCCIYMILASWFIYCLCIPHLSICASELWGWFMLRQTHHKVRGLWGFRRRFVEVSPALLTLLIAIVRNPYQKIDPPLAHRCLLKQEWLFVDSRSAIKGVKVTVSSNASEGSFFRFFQHGVWVQRNTFLMANMKGALKILVYPDSYKKKLPSGLPKNATICWDETEIPKRSVSVFLCYIAESDLIFCWGCSMIGEMLVCFKTTTIQSKDEGAIGTCSPCCCHLCIDSYPHEMKSWFFLGRSRWHPWHHPSVWNVGKTMRYTDVRYLKKITWGQKFHFSSKWNRTLNTTLYLRK